MGKHPTLYFCAKLLYYILYAATLFGIYYIAPEKLAALVGAIKIYICVMLIWSFHPFTKRQNTVDSHEREMIVSSAIFLLLTTSIGDSLVHWNL